MADLLELDIPAGWSPEYIERLVQVRLDRELESSLLHDRLDYAEKRSRMPTAVRHHWDQVERDG